jgi:hypothetical protein
MKKVLLAILLLSSTAIAARVDSIVAPVGWLRERQEDTGKLTTVFFSNDPEIRKSSESKSPAPIATIILGISEDSAAGEKLVQKWKVNVEKPTGRTFKKRIRAQTLLLKEFTTGVTRVYVTHARAGRKNLTAILTIAEPVDGFRDKYVDVLGQILDQLVLTTTPATEPASSQT